MVLAAVISVLCARTLTDAGSWAAIVAAAVVVGGLIFGFVRWMIRTFREQVLFRAEYQHSEQLSVFTHEVDASSSLQRVQITLRMRMNTFVEFVALVFNGNGTLPEIKGLDDWVWGEGKMDSNIRTYPVPYAPQKGTWYWRYSSPQHRFRRSRITIGMNFLATDWFDGYLEFQMTSQDAPKIQRLPFKVIKRAGQVDEKKS